MVYALLLHLLLQLEISLWCSVLRLAVSNVSVVGGLRHQIVFAAVRTSNRVANLMHGALVEDEHLLLLEDLVAELTRQLSTASSTKQSVYVCTYTCT